MVLFSLKGKEIVNGSSSTLKSLPLTILSETPLSHRVIDGFFRHFVGKDTPIAPASLRTLKNLREETDSEIFCSDGMTLAKTWLHEGKEGHAVALLHLMSEAITENSQWVSQVSAKIQTKLKTEHALAQGFGPWTHRSEYFLQRLVREATDPILLMGFTFGTAAFQFGRWGMLKTFSRAAFSQGPLSRSLMGTLAWGSGVISESAAFNFSLKGLQWVFCDVPFSPLSTEEFWGTALTLGLFRGTHQWLEQGMRRYHGIPQFSGAPLPVSPGIPGRFIQGATHFGVSWGALALSHHLQGGWGWRHPMAGQDVLTESLGILIQLKMAGKIFQQIQPRALQAWGGRLEQEARWLQHAPRVVARRFPTSGDTDGGIIGRLGALFSTSFQVKTVSAGIPNLLFGGPRFLMAEFKDKSEAPPERFQSGVKIKVGIHADLIRVLEASPWPTLITDAEGRMIGANLAAQSILRSGEPDWVGKPWDSIFTPTKNASTVVKVASPSGELREFQRQEIALSTSKHQIQIFKEMSEGSDQPFGNKSKKISNNKRMLHLMKGAIHDARNHLSVVHSFFNGYFPQMAAYLRNNPHFADAVEAGQDGGLAVNNMVSQMKAIMNFSIGMQTPLEPIHIGELLSLTVRANGFTVLSRHHEIINLSPEVEGVFQGNQNILMSCIGNLIKNSLDAMPQGGSIDVGAVKEGSQIRLVIQDHGTGIPAKHLDKIMDPEFTTKRATKGYGMGLFMVRTMVEELMHGKVEIESHEGVGTRVSLIFPVVAE